MAKVLSIIIPAYNESATIFELLSRVQKVKLIEGIRKEIIIVDDSSTDNTKEQIQSFITAHPDEQILYLLQNKNSGKGSAIHRALEQVSGDYIIIQDADLEYDPSDYNKLLEPIMSGNADVVYGSRFMGGNAHRVLFFWHSMGNKFLTFLTNVFSNVNLTDMETCYKLFRVEALKGLNLKEKKFGFEPEVTIKVSKIPGIRIYETGISYYGRTYKDGKKIKWTDGFRAIWCIIKYGLFTGKSGTFKS